MQAIKRYKEERHFPEDQRVRQTCPSCGGWIYIVDRDEEGPIFPHLCSRCTSKNLKDREDMFKAHPEKREEIERKYADFKERMLKQPCAVCEKKPRVPGWRWCLECAIAQNEKDLEAELAKPFHRNEEAIEAMKARIERFKERLKNGSA